MYSAQCPATRMLFGSREEVYQASVHAYLTGAANAYISSPEWTVEMERPAGSGCLDLIIKRGQ